MLNRIYRPVLNSLIFWTVLMPIASAQTRLEQLLSDIQITRVSEFRYTETREMQLLNQVSVAEGRMYVSPEQMTIEQIKPDQALILITANRLQYLAPSRGVRFVKRLKGPLSVPGIGSFIGLLQAQLTLEQLQAQFLLEVEEAEQRWQIILQPREQIAIRSMIISGLVGQGASLLQLDYIDGDTTVWALSVLSEGAEAQQKLDKLLELFAVLSQPGESGQAR